MNYKNCAGFTIMELVVVIAITAVLSGIILFSIAQYISKGKDSNTAGNLAVLIPAGEVFYSGNGNSYQGFCDPTQSAGSVFKNAISQMPKNPNGPCYSGSSTTYTSTTNPAGACCSVVDSSQNYQAWAACAKEFTDTTRAYCVDSRGVKEDMCNSSCVIGLTQCPDPSTQISCH